MAARFESSRLLITRGISGCNRNYVDPIETFDLKETFTDRRRIGAS